ncbi:MAG: DNA-directed RNA polymerase subunit alpha [Patescibacteria group bacterium]|nr:DNA-directed RNA polymerase subunit alpha [Patescibacteria group bacterium]
MLSVSLPSPPQYEEIGENTGRFIIKGCYPGYGTTLGNSIRRAMLSSLPGNAAVAVKIKGITHEFTTVKGVLEDAVQIILNLKRVCFKLNGVEEATIFLKVKGEKTVTAKDFKTTSEVEVVNVKQPIATLTSSSAELDMEVKVRQGLGYVPIELQDREEKEIGTIAVDAVYTPIKRVNFTVENMRVGKKTDFDKITLDVATDGSIAPQEAYVQTIEILMSQYNAIANIDEGERPEDIIEEDVDKAKDEAKKESKEKLKKEDKDTQISELNLSTRTQNILAAAGIKMVSDIAAMSNEDLKDLEGMGDVGIKEIKKTIGTFGITLKASE